MTNLAMINHHLEGGVLRPKRFLDTPEVPLARGVVGLLLPLDPGDIRYGVKPN